MKKKFKLLTSIASLGLALALMTFGVLAATATSVDINNSVKFDATPNVKGTVTLTLTKPEETKATLTSVASDLYTAGSANVVFQGTEKAGTDDAKINTVWTIGDLEYEAVPGYDGTFSYAYTVRVENNVAEATDSYTVLHVKNFNVPEANTIGLSSIAVTYGVGSKGAESDGTYKLARGEHLEYTVTVTINVNQSLAKQVIDSDFQLEMIAAA